MDRRMEKRIELDATPEQVWEAIATGPGTAAWFVPHTIEPRTGGAVEQSFGGQMDITGKVLAYEPGRRFAYAAAEPPAADTADYAYEFLVEARAGGGTVLRFVQSGFTDEGWEEEYHSFDAGWDLFFGNLAAYLEHFAGEPVSTIVTMSYVPDTAAEAWPVLHRALGLTAHPAAGADVTLTPAGLDPITGIVDVATPEFLGVRSPHALHRFGAEGGACCGVSAYHYLYGEPVDGKALTTAWQHWLGCLFPVGATS